MKENRFLECLKILELFFPKEDKKDILKKFCSELMQTGYNVNVDCTKYNVSPHIYNQEMINLYSKSDAFVYELLVGSLKKESIKKNNFIIKKINKYLNSKDKINILCFGDGIGSDSLNFTKSGYSVTYFDIEGKISDFARLNFKLNKVDNLIQTIFKNSHLLENAYDVVICREVLEHLEDPFETVKKLRSLLKNDGLLFLSESFSSVNKNFPTHLSSNLKYVNKTIEIIVEIGFQYLETYNYTNLNIFKKRNFTDTSRFSSIPIKPWKIRLKKKIRDKIIYLLS